MSRRTVFPLCFIIGTVVHLFVMLELHYNTLQYVVSVLFFELEKGDKVALAH